MFFFLLVWFSSSQIRTWDGWVQSANATALLCHTPFHYTWTCKRADSGSHLTPYHSLAKAKLLTASRGYSCSVGRASWMKAPWRRYNSSEVGLNPVHSIRCLEKIKIKICGKKHWNNIEVWEFVPKNSEKHYLIIFSIIIQLSAYLPVDLANSSYKMGKILDC